MGLPLTRPDATMTRCVAALWKKLDLAAPGGCTRYQELHIVSTVLFAASRRCAAGGHCAGNEAKTEHCGALRFGIGSAE
eukprot:Skav204202  [mRNA]  locus=scaffold985:74328:79055:+ [translate_table: standard]